MTGQDLSSDKRDSRTMMGSAGQPSPNFAQRVAEIFTAAAERAPDGRAMFVEHACEGDTALRAEVESLLNAYEASHGFLDDTTSSVLPRGWAELPDDTEAGRTIGAYRVVREIGRGGMGVVYLAERADGQFEQRVALKLVRTGLHFDRYVHRFLRERRILARLQHPGIAGLLDGGVTKDGRPFLVMEFVEGVPLTDHCDRNALSIDERLRLFADACAAVHYAHRNLVVHRDLKPWNILVTAEGHVKLLDFGIARLLEPALTEDVSTSTEFGFRAMTPEYAAPEQVSGTSITTATDVYALGAVLYELLSGHRPHRFPRRTVEEITRVLTSEPPRPPSARVDDVEEDHGGDDGARPAPERIAAARATTTDRLRRRLRGDLDAIVLTALRTEPERRYASAQALLDDVAHHLSGLPVSARKDSLGYRVGRFVRRNRAATLAGAVAFGSLLLGIGATAWQARTALRQRDAALREADKAERASAFMMKVFQLADPNLAHGKNLTVREALDSGRTWIERQFAGHPALHAEMAFQLGKVYYDLGLYMEAKDLWETALETRPVASGDPNDELFTGLLSLAQVLTQTGPADSAEALARRALSMLGAWSDRDDRRYMATQVLDRLANTLRKQDRLDEAERHAREALGALPPRYGNAANRRTVILTTLGHVLRAKGDAAGAEAVYREVLDARIRLWGIEHPEVANALVNLAGAISDRDRQEEAEQLYRRGLNMRLKLQGEGHPDYGIDLAALALVLYRTGAFDSAIVTYEHAIELQRRVLPPLSSFRIDSRIGYGEALLARGRAAQAEVVLHEALEAASRAYAADHSTVAEAKSGLGAALMQLGRPNEAAPLLLDAERVLAEKRGGDAPSTRRARARLQSLNQARGVAASDSRE
jgi:serine/threonine protein kinase/tetratricopeptide (TPR) repeat protein